MVQTISEQLNSLDFSFPSKVSLKPVLKAWQTDQDSHPLLQKFSSDVLALQDQQPELFEAYDNTDFLRQAQDSLQLLLTPVLSYTKAKHSLAAVARPYYYDFIYTSDAFRELLLDQNGMLKAQPKMDLETFNFGRELHVYTVIARQCYGIEFNFSKHPIFITIDPGTGLKRYFQFFYDCQHLEVKMLGRSKKPSSKLVEKLRQNMLDKATWQQWIRPEEYELNGVVIIHAIDITEREVVSNMYETLTNGTSLISRQGMQLFNDSVRDLLGRNDINVRLFGKQADKIFMIMPGCCQGTAGCLISNSQHFAYEEMARSVYVEAKKQATDFYSVKDVAALDSNVPVHRMLQQEGVGSLLLMPLFDEGQMYGILQLDFPDSGLDHSDIALKMYDMRAIAMLGLKHSQQTLEQGVQAIIQQKSSVVHKAVEWRFQKAALNALLSGQSEYMEEIVFNEVYPLFSETDIKDSSMFRNKAIVADLRTQLALARQVLHSAQDKIPILDEFDFRIEYFLQELDEGLKSGDEATINQFFRQELEPAFEQLARLGGAVQHAVQHYKSQLNPRYRAVHQQRKDYEDSVLQLNDAIARYLDQEQQQAQKVFPHYFEKTCTDGVEMMMYLGASMVEDGHFDLFYLRNLRLWQLRITCEIARLCESLKPRLRLPLETTHLILVRDAPMSIRFSETERDFIVDGAYNIHYEIMKKRIDKALVNGSTERLTQPGKIAIVYSHNKEAQEYRRYIKFLQHQGYLLEPVEDLALESLQGLQGLRALRVTVDVQNQGLSKTVTDLLQQMDGTAVPGNVSAAPTSEHSLLQTG